MNEREAREDGYLHEATPEQLEQAVAWNHRQWMILKARAAGGEVREAQGVTWTYAGPQGEAMILFPQLTAAGADERLDEIARYYRERRPEGLVGLWSLDPPEPPDLGARLLARGFQDGWQPRWMALDLERMSAAHGRPEGLEIAPVETAAEWTVEDLPYHSRQAAAIRHAAMALQPRRVWHFAAWLEGQPVGQSTLCVTTGPLGVAGLYDIGVVPGAQGQGVGKAVTLAACRYARDLGCRYALLNATGERMYQQIGFATLGYGCTWWFDACR